MGEKCTTTSKTNYLWICLYFFIQHQQVVTFSSVSFTCFTIEQTMLDYLCTKIQDSLPIKPTINNQGARLYP